MEGSGIKDTTAYAIIRQMTDHIWGPDEKFEDGEIVSICRLFSSRGGSWIALMDGSMDQAVLLEESIEEFIKSRRYSVIARRILSR